MNLATRSALALFAAVPFVAIACGGSDSGDAADSTPTKQAPQFVGTPNGKAISETQACERLFNATAKGCTISQPTCPSRLRTAYPLGDSKYFCSTWDEGVVKSCEDYLASLSCEDRQTYPCKLVYFEKTGTGAETCEGAGGAGGAGGSAGAGGSTAGAGGSTAGAGGSTAGAGGSAAGAGGSTAGAGGSTAGAGGSTAGAGGSTAGAGGSTAGAGGATAGAGGSTAGAGGASAGAGGN